MSMPSRTGRNWPQAMRPLETRQRARVVASFAEYLAEDVGDDPNRALDAMGTLAECARTTPNCWRSHGAR